MPIKGNVVRFKGEKELYVVAEADSSGSYPKRKLDKCVLLPFKHSNCSTHLSRKHPFTRERKLYEACRQEECGHHEYECPTEKVPTEHNVDNLEYVADNIEEFMMEKLKAVMYD